jgi:hypothetical protein
VASEGLVDAIGRLQATVVILLEGLEQYNTLLIENLKSISNGNTSNVGDPEPEPEPEPEPRRRLVRSGR